MAILFADDFNGYGTNGALLFDGLWGSGEFDIQTDPDPNATGKAIRWGGFGNNARRPFSKGALATAGLAVRLWMVGLPSFTVNQFRFLDASNNPNTSLAITPTGVIEVYNGAPGPGGVLLGATTAPVLTANAWHHIEMKVLTSGNVASGTVDVRVDGTPVLSVSAVATGVAYQLGLGTTNDYNGTAGCTSFNKDLVVWDGSGAHNTDFLGTVSVIGMTPASDVSLGWTPRTGTTGWNLLDNSPPVDTTDYISAPYPLPSPSEFTLTDLPTNVTSVRAMITQVRARKANGGDGNIQSSLVSTGGDTAAGADRPITTAFTYYEDVFEVDPHTSNSWTPAAANAADYKINRTI